MVEVGDGLRCIAITEDDRPCPIRRVKGPYCLQHKSLGSELMTDTIQRLADPEKVDDRYELIKGIFLRMPLKEHKRRIQRLKPRIQGTESEFNMQMIILEDLVR